MSYADEYRTAADDIANTLEVLAKELRTKSYQSVASGLTDTWLGPLVCDLAGLAQFAELCRCNDARNGQ